MSFKKRKEIAVLRCLLSVSVYSPEAAVGELCIFLLTPHIHSQHLQSYVILPFYSAAKNSLVFCLYCQLLLFCFWSGTFEVFSLQVLYNSQTGTNVEICPKTSLTIYCMKSNNTCWYGDRSKEHFSYYGALSPFLLFFLFFPVEACKVLSLLVYFLQSKVAKLDHVNVLWEYLFFPHSE